MESDCVVRERGWQAQSVLMLTDGRRLTVFVTVHAPDIRRADFTVRGPQGTELDHVFHKAGGHAPDTVVYESVTTDGSFEASVVVAARRHPGASVILALGDRIAARDGSTDEALVVTLPG